MARLEPRRPRGIDLVRRLTNFLGRRLYRDLPEPTLVLAHHRPLMLGFGTVALAGDRFSHAVDERYKSLAMLRTAQLIGCEWCLDFGSRLAGDCGIPADSLRDLSVWRSSPRFDDLERLVLEYAEAMTRTPVEVSDDLFAALRVHFDERQMVELTMSIAMENMYSRSNWAFGIEGQGYAEGMYCVRPEAANTTATPGDPAAVA